MHLIGFVIAGIGDHDDVDAGAIGEFALAFSAAGDLLATGAADGSIRLWSFPDLAPVRGMRESEVHVLGLAFTSGDRELIALGADHSLRVFDVGRGVEVLSVPVGDDPTAGLVAFSASADGRVLAFGSRTTCVLDLR